MRIKQRTLGIVAGFVACGVFGIFNAQAADVQTKATDSTEKSAQTEKAPAKNAKVKQDKKLVPQTTCPVMGGEIDKSQYVDYKGKRIYVCCPGCIEEVKKNPEKYIKKLQDKGQDVEVIKQGS